MTDDSTSRRERRDPGGGSVGQRQPGGDKSLGDVQHHDQSPPSKTDLTGGIGRGGMTRPAVAHVHAFDEPRDPDGGRERAKKVADQTEGESSEGLWTCQ